MEKETIRGHQGDVQFATVNELPKEAVEIKNSPIAYGETNGHAHIVTGNVKRYEHSGRLFFVVMQLGAMLQHVRISEMDEKAYQTTKELPMADHKPVLLPPGVYEFWIQNQYNPYKKIFEKVID